MCPSSTAFISSNTFFKLVLLLRYHMKIQATILRRWFHQCVQHVWNLNHPCNIYEQLTRIPCPCGLLCVLHQLLPNSQTKYLPKYQIACICVCKFKNLKETFWKFLKHSGTCTCQQPLAFLQNPSDPFGNLWNHSDRILLFCQILLFFSTGRCKSTNQTAGICTQKSRQQVFWSLHYISSVK